MFLFLFPAPSFAYPVLLWETGGVTVFASSISLESVGMASDGSHGAIITWIDHQNLINPIHAQRVNSAGNPLWATNGVPVCTAVGTQDLPVITDDGSGGAIIAWFEEINGIYGIYAQRIDPSGNLLWGANGVHVATPELVPAAIELLQSGIRITSNGSGGAIITWKNFSGGGVYATIFAQKVDLNGNKQWGGSGKAVTGLILTFGAGYDVTRDGYGGALIAWQAIKPTTNWDIFAQRVNSAGDRLWTTGGVTVCAALNTQHPPKVISDGSGGAIILWPDSRPNVDGLSDLYAQRVNSTGNRVWATDGVPVCTALNNQQEPTMVGDGTGGAIICWTDIRDIPSRIYEQKVDSTGNLLLTINGLSLCANTTSSEFINQMVSDASGGAIVLWVSTSYKSIFAQRINSAGGIAWPAWATDGFPVGTTDLLNPFLNLAALISGDTGEAIVAWTRIRVGDEIFLYAQKIGDFIGLPPVVTLEAPTATGITLDAGIKYTISWEATDEIGFPLSDYISIYLSTNEGLSWTPITIIEENDPGSVAGTFEWTVPNVISTNCRISIEARDADGLKGYAISPPFEINGTWLLIDDLRVDDKADHETISRQPRVRAVISDEDGINTISTIEISIDGNTYSYTSPEINYIFDYGTGRLDFTFPTKFPPGTYTVTVKAWDINGFMSEASVTGLEIPAVPNEPVFTDMAADPVIVPAGTSPIIRLAYVLNYDFGLEIIVRPALPPFTQLFKKRCYAGGPGGAYGYNEFTIGPLPPMSSGGYDILFVYNNKVVKSLSIESK